MFANGLAMTWPRRHASDELVDSGQQRAAPGQDDLVDLVVRSGGEEELESARYFERQGFHERLRRSVS